MSGRQTIIQTEALFALNILRDRHIRRFVPFSQRVFAFTILVLIMRTHKAFYAASCLLNSGRPFALSVTMILMTMRMKVLSEKHKELSQTISSLVCSIRTEAGCQSCDFCLNAEDENDLLLLEQWDSEEHLQAHINSEQFRVLRGTTTLLREPCEMKFHHDVLPPGGANA